ncbi:DUF1521 domain-containing protein (plasmid) [Bosea vestrisii]|uniref:DUF1521 domain-containing protein n=1 Tax=Bosea vestrisii TaxID=151416 RepID=UPI0024DF62D7|nr:DUF1521 domain-containing protein [Bosea vestrisii]WID99701.1 DUF1521 domain-containing protein [Bosea vestrisii]
MNGIPNWGYIPVALPFPGFVGGASAGQPTTDAFTAPQQAGSNDFLGSVRSAATSGEKRDLIDAYAAGFIAATRGSGNAGAPSTPTYMPSAPTPGLPALPTSQTSPVAGVPTMAGIEQARREAFAGVMEGFQHFAGLIEESKIPEQAKNQMLDGLAGLMSQFAGLANIGAGNGGQLPQLPRPNLPAPGNGGSDGSGSNSGASDVWTHEKKDDGTAQIRLGDKYTIDLKEGDESFTVRNNETGAVTRVWGDPHVDKDGDGKNDFDFKENMTFQLDDGTKITVNTVDGGNGKTFSSGLTITNGNNAIQVTGLAGDKDGKNNLELIQSNAGTTLDQLTADGAQIIYERGKDWVGANGQSINQAAIEAAEQRYG